MIRHPQSVFISLLFLLMAFSATFASVSNELGNRYIHEKWQQERGLPFDSVLSSTQSRDGFIWLALGRGIARFDGVRFTYFNHENTPIIKDGLFGQALEDREGNLWFSSENGLMRYRDGEFSLFTSENGLPNSVVYSLYEDREGNLWVGTEKGLARREGDHFVAIVHPNIGGVVAIAEREDGDIVMATPYSVYTVRKGVFEPTPVLETPNVYALLTDRSGRLWIGSTSGLLCISNGQTKLYTMHDGLPTNYINGLTEDREGNLWISTDGGGIVRWNGAAFEVYNHQQGLSDDAVNHIFPDHDGGLWIATNGGLDYLRENSFTAYSKQNGLPDNHVWAVYEDRAQNLWIGTNGGGLNRVSGGKVKSFRVADGMPSDKVFSILETSDGTVIAGTDNGLAQIRGDRVSLFDVAPDSREWMVYSLHEDDAGAVWLCTKNHGLIRWQNGQLTRYSTSGVFSSSKVRNAVSAPDGGLWVAAGKINYFHDGQFRSWGEQEGIKGEVFGLYPDGSRLWFGTYSGGLYLLDGDKITSFSNKATGLTEMVFSILEDNNGNLWLSYEGGLQRVSKQELLDYAAGLRRDFNVMTFDRRDGLVNAEFNATGRNAGWKMADGRMIFANINGAVILNPNEIKFNTEPPPVFINEVFYNQDAVKLTDAIELPPGGNNLEFRYSAPFFTAPTRVRFKYKLEGFDKEWTEAGTRRTAYYMNLPPGNYRFRVIASNGNGVWNETGAVIEFHLQPHFYQTTWFYLLCAAGLGLTVIGLYRLRVHQLKRSARLLEQQVNDRTQALQEEVAVREQAEESLRAARDDLENQVQRRTAELASAISVLREQREFLYVTLSSIGDAVVAADEKGSVTFLNPIAQSLTGWTITEAVGQPLYAVLRFSDFVDETEAAKISTGIVEDDGSSRRQKHLITRAGEKIPVKVHISQIHQTQEQDAGSVITFWDMRPQIDAEAERRKLEEQLFRAQKMESIGTLAGGVAHDFNNLLTIILGNANLMSLSFAADDPRAKRLAEINQAAQRGAEVTRQLLTFSRRQPLERRPLEITPVIDDLLKLLNRVIGEKIEIRVRNAPDLPQVFGDSPQLGQVFMNLVVNARDAMPAGGVIQIETSNITVNDDFCHRHKWARAGEFVRVDVSDNGEGMDDETLERIFEPFFTTKELGKGTGLGLAVVYGIVEQHNGFINVASEIGKGTTFSVFLPIAKADAINEEQKNAGTAVSGRRETILLAEDETMLRELATEILESHNYRVLVAADGTEAVELYREHNEEINLLLFDASMPRMDGRDAYEKISQLNDQVPILFVTGYSEEIFQQPDFLNSPNRMILLKPYQPDMLLSKIRELLDRKPAHSQNYEAN